MSRFHRGGLLASIVLVIAGSASRAVEQKEIEKAIDAGVKALRGMQTDDGTWPHAEIGATALAGLTLLECGAKSDAQDIARAAGAVRKASYTLTYNYSISLAILFLDRLGDPNDAPLIQSLTVRLLAGQTSSGGWSYRSPQLPDEEVRRLQTRRGERKEPVGRPQPAPADGIKRPFREISPEIQQQLLLLKRMSSLAPEMRPDNSNTQFAVLALWVARRYGLPVGDALKRVEIRFRTSQNSDGGWGYYDARTSAREHERRSTSSMTCAGLLGLAVADGNGAENARERAPTAKPSRDIDKDSHMRKALFALGQSVGRPTEKREGSRPDKASALPRIGGRSYYFLWSLERVAVALGLKTIGKKDWYSWGAEILLANQEPDGSWKGFYGESGADTCFALLFLKQANLVPDLTTQLAGRVQDPGERALKGGDLRDMFAREKSGDFVSGIEGKGGKPPRDGQHPDEIAKNRVPNVAGKDPAPLPATRPEPPPPKAEKPPAKKDPAPDAPSSTTERMAEGLAKSNGSRFSLLLHNYRIGKGAEFTEVLALAIPQMSGARQRETREALTGRLTRMKDTTLKEYLADENLEIRIAAARACAKKGSKGLIPYLIPLLRDSRGGMAEAAHHALKDLTGQDFGPKPNSNRDERVEASRQWAEWWKKQEVKKDNPRESPAKRQ